MIINLRKEIEDALHQQLKTPKDFEFLRERIYARQHILISRTTLMRIWGYVDEDVEPRKGTLDILAQYLGYQSWDDYNMNAQRSKEKQSSPVLNRRLSVAQALNYGDKVRLTWQPKRVCDVEYLGDLNFRVVASENTRLHQGDLFQCSLIIEGEPLYIDNLQQDHHLPIAYVCGKKSGVHYEFITG